jgi:hypothetical protein
MTILVRELKHLKPETWYAARFDPPKCGGCQWYLGKSEAEAIRNLIEAIGKDFGVFLIVEE